MKKLGIKQSFKNPKFKYGGYATLMTAVVLVILVVVNLVVDQISFKVDMTENHLYSLSDQTQKVLGSLKEDVRIIGLYQAGKENNDVIEILDRYQRQSDKVTVKTFDPVKYPQMAMKYQTNGEQLDLGTIIVESGDKFKVIDQMDLYDLAYSQYGQPSIEGMTVEQRVTGAILYVTTNELPVVYALKGHGEEEFPMELKKQFDIENYAVKDLDLVTEDKVPDDAHALFVFSPKRDLSDDEQKKIQDYLVNEGRAFFAMDLLKTDLPNFQKVFNYYGIEMKNAIVVEGDRKFHAGNPLWLLPEFQTQDIVNPLKDSDLRVMIPVAQPIQELDVKRHSVKIEPLIKTSSNSWAKTDLNTKTLESEAGDLKGPFNVAVAITEETFENDKTKQTKLVVVGNGQFLKDPRFYGYGNEDMLMNSLNWLRERKESISIRPKKITQAPLNINALQKLIWAGVSVALIPLIIFAMGLTVWLRRRHL